MTVSIKMEEAKMTQKLEKALQTAGLGILLHTFLGEKVSTNMSKYRHSGVSQLCCLYLTIRYMFRSYP